MNKLIEKKETRGRKKKITTQQVIEYLEDIGQAKVKEMANNFETCNHTVRERIKEGKKDGECIIHDNNGYMLIKKIENENQIDSVTHYLLWTMGVLKGGAVNGIPAKKLIAENKQKFKEFLSKEDRKMLYENMTIITRILDYLEIEDQME